MRKLTKQEQSIRLLSQKLLIQEQFISKLEEQNRLLTVSFELLTKMEESNRSRLAASALVESRMERVNDNLLRVLKSFDFLYGKLTELELVLTKTKKSTR
jgi:uncharacterized protein YjcR